MIAGVNRIDHDPNRKGNVAELAIATEAARLGLSVFKPPTEHERCDLVLGIRGRFLGVQRKWGGIQGDIGLRASQVLTSLPDEGLRDWYLWRARRRCRGGLLRGA